MHLRVFQREFSEVSLKNRLYLLRSPVLILLGGKGYTYRERFLSGGVSGRGEEKIRFGGDLFPQKKKTSPAQVSGCWPGAHQRRSSVSSPTKKGDLFIRAVAGCWVKTGVLKNTSG